MRNMAPIEEAGMNSDDAGKAIGQKLATALIAAQKTAKAVGKDAENTFHHYAYASAEAVIAEARSALSGAGLAVVTASWHAMASPAGESLAVTYLLIHDSGESMSFVTETAVVPEKGRPLDKAQATALTYSLSYFLRGLLLLPRVEEGTDADQRDDRGTPARTRAPAASMQEEVASARTKIANTATLAELADLWQKCGWSGALKRAVKPDLDKRKGQLEAAGKGPCDACGAAAGQPCADGCPAAAEEAAAANDEDLPEVFPNFGRSKGKPIAGASSGDLDFYASAARRSLDDPSKERFHDRERALLRAIEREQQRVGGHA
jgi:hypothetical protein